MKNSILLYALFVSLMTINKVIAQNADVTINGSVTTNGSWSGSTTGPYVFTPNANAATVLNTDIINRLTGGGGFAINDVTITTACGSCTDAGNITIANSITATNNSALTPSFSLTAANTTNVAATIDLTAAAGATGADNSGNTNATGGEGGMGGNGINIFFSNTNPGGSIILSNNASIITSGGNGGMGGIGGDLGGVGGDGGAGGNAGSITLLSLGSCIINSGSSLLANGGNGGTAGTPGGGGPAGIDGMNGAANDIFITGQNGITIAGDLMAIGLTNGNFTINDGNSVVTTGGTNDGQTAGVIAGGNLTKNGNGTFFIGGNNTYTGTTTVNAGTLRPTNNTVVPNTNGPFGNNAGGLFLNGGTIESNVTIFTRPISITATGSRIDAYGTGRTISSTINQTIAGSFNLNIGGTTTSGAEGQLLTLSGVISNSLGTLSLTKTGTSEVALSAANTYDGGTILSNGNLDINNANALGNITGTFTIDSATTINNTSGSSITTSNYPMVWNGDFTFAGTNALDLGTGAITMNSDILLTATSSSLTIGGTINNVTENFTKAGTGQLSFGNQAITLNNFTNSGGTLILTAGNLSIAGNFINNGIITNGGGIVTFNGTIAQTIGGSKPTTFNDLTINNTYTTSPQITLTNNETIAGTLTLTQGNIDGQTNSDTIFVSNTATAAISRSGGYIIGNLARSITNTGSPAYTYYIGTTTNYAPVSITLNSLSTGGFITGSMTGGDNPNICSSVINTGLTVNDYWTFTNSGVTFTDYSATFSYPPADLDAGVIAANFGLGKYNGIWNYPTISGTPSTSVTSISNETAFGSFAIGDTITNKISYSAGSFCTTISSPQPVTIIGTQGGTFSSAAGLTLNPVTGAIIPSTSMPATYTVTYTIPAGVCPPYLTITTVTINAAPTASVSVNSPGSTVLDCNQTEINVIAMPAGAASYLWSGGNNPNSLGNSFITPNTYSLTITANNGCQGNTTITITQDTITPSAGISVSNTGGTTVLNCYNTAIYVTATGIGNYLWSGGDSLSTSKNNSFSEPDSYSLTVTASNGCKNKSTITITRDTITPTAGITNNTGTTILDCLHPIVHVTATGGAYYEWQGGNSISSDTNSFTTPNLYFVKVIGSNGCFIYDSILITQNVAHITYSSNVLTCVTNSVGVKATGGGTYSWSGGNTPATDTNTFSTPGTYVVTVTAGNGCISSDSIAIVIDTVPLKILTSLGTTVLDCKNSHIDVSANRGANSFSWSGGSTPSSANNGFISPGTYSLTAIIDNGCNNTAVISITLDTLKPAASITYTVSPVISCTNASINVSATGGVNYLWTGGTSTATNINSFTTAGIYTVTVTGSNSCSDTASITITKDTVAPVIAITGTTLLTCTTTSVSVIASGASNYTWSGGTSPSSANNGFISPGTYSLTATGTNGCASDTSITITQNISAPSISIFNNSGTYTLTCAANQIIVTASGANSYSWSGGNSTATAIDTLTALGTYTVTGTGTNGCASDTSITIYQAAPVPIPITIINHTGTTLLCNQHQFIDVKAIGGGVGTSYSWSGGNTPLSDSNTFVTAGIYTVTSLASGGCGGTTATIQITQLSAAVSLTEGNDTSCIGQYSSFSFAATPNNAGINPSYQWRVNGNYAGTNSATYTSSTIHSGDVVDVIVTSTTMSVTTISNAIAMIVNPLPPKPKITLAANSFMSSAPSGNQWYLNGILINGATSQSYPVKQAGFYAVEVTDKGCKTTSDITLGVDTYTASNNTVTVYPNPFTQQTTVLFDKEVKNATIKVAGLSGATIRETTCSGKQTIIDRDELEAGIYFIQVIIDGKLIANEKVVIQ